MLPTQKNSLQVIMISCWYMHVCYIYFYYCSLYYSYEDIISLAGCHSLQYNISYLFNLIIAINSRFLFVFVCMCEKLLDRQTTWGVSFAKSQILRCCDAAMIPLYWSEALCLFFLVLSSQVWEHLYGLYLVDWVFVPSLQWDWAIYWSIRYQVIVKMLNYFRRLHILLDTL